jgi:hypothetical protein
MLLDELERQSIYILLEAIRQSLPAAQIVRTGVSH